MDFAAYGIIAFGTRASSFDIERHLLLCEAYVATLPHASENNEPRSDQITTVWPMQTNEAANALNRAHRDRVCSRAVAEYGLVTARQAINDAERTGIKLSGTGPFLLAWSPSGDKGKSDALILSLDLSLVQNYEQAVFIFDKWRNEIEMDRSNWENGWDIEKVRITIQQWVDKYGEKIVNILPL